MTEVNREQSKERRSVTNTDLTPPPTPAEVILRLWREQDQAEARPTTPTDFARGNRP